MIRHSSRSAVLVLTLTASAFAQTSGNKGGITTPTPSIPTPAPSRPTTTLPSNTQSPLPTDIARPIYISGKVTLDDGTPPPEPLVLELSCSGSRRNLGYTDSKGRFNIDLSDRSSSALFADASQTGSFGNRETSNSSSNSARSLGSSSNPSFSDRSFAGCDLRAVLPGFRSDQVNLGTRRSLDNPEVGNIVLHRLGNVEGFTISATSALAPKDARRAFEKGRAEAAKQKWENAEREFEKAVDLYPKYASAWYDLGLVQYQLKNVEGARKSYAQALAADPKFLNPYQQLSLIAVREANWAEVEATTARLLRLNPVDFPQSWFYNAYANYQLKNMTAAEKAARDGLAADPRNQVPRLNQLLGIILALKEDYPAAAELLRTYLRLVPDASDKETVNKQLAELSKSMTPQAANKVPE